MPSLLLQIDANRLLISSMNNIYHYKYWKVISNLNQNLKNWCSLTAKKRWVSQRNFGLIETLRTLRIPHTKFGWTRLNPWHNDSFLNRTKYVKMSKIMCGKQSFFPRKLHYKLLPIVLDIHCQAMRIANCMFGCIWKTPLLYKKNAYFWNSYKNLTSFLDEIRHFFLIETLYKTGISHRKCDWICIIHRLD